MADKSTRLIHDALARAAAEPEGLALLAGKSDPGLFPPTALARAAAERAKANGLLEVVRTEVRGKLSREIVTLTDKGRDYLTRRADPREVLEDFVRVLESRQTDIQQLIAAARQMQQSLQCVQAAVAASGSISNRPSPRTAHTCWPSVSARLPIAGPGRSRQAPS